MHLVRGADLLAAALETARIDTVFTLSGNHVMSVFDALIDRPIRLIHTRHEAAAVHMADAFARVSGTVGVALVTGGPGHVNALGALCTASAGETPLILLSGHAPLSECGNGAFQEFDQVSCAAPLTKASWVVQSTAALADDLARAFRIAQSGRPGPVHLSLPSDLLDAECAAPSPLHPAMFAPSTRHLDPDKAARIAERIAAAERPLIIAPPALCTRLGRAILRRLDSLGVPVIEMESPRGIKDPSLGQIVDLLHEVDLIVLLGKSLDYTLGFGAIAPRAHWIVIDPEQPILARAERLLAGRIQAAHADIAAAINDLTGFSQRQRAIFPQWTSRVASAIRQRPVVSKSDHNTAAPTSASLSTLLGRVVASLQDPVLICDGGEIGQWAQAFVTAPDRLINGVAGAIGSAIPFAIGAKAATSDRPVIAVSGDGAFGFHLAEFETAMRENLPFIAVVGNDGRWNAEHQLQIRRFGAGRTIGCDLVPATRYDRVAVALGGHGEYVTAMDAIEPALRRAIASGQPACINVMIEGLPAP